jgi:D-alanyl-D-alanine dipeptidase
MEASRATAASSAPMSFGDVLGLTVMRRAWYAQKEPVQQTVARFAHGAWCLGLAVVLAGLPAQQQKVPTADSRNLSPIDESRQALLVITDRWESVNGTAQRVEREDRAAAWRPVGSPVPVVVGSNGLAWGRGLQAESAGGPIKKEGDGKSPAGVFHLASVFGQSPDGPPGLSMPYQSLGNNVECVDDVRSTHYNELVSRQQVERADWSSSEKMWAEPLYKWGVVVEHNGTPARVTRREPSARAAEPGAGSCIFLHIWKGPASGTAGCTAMAEAKLLETIKWLETEKNPVLIQLPRREYQRLKSAWRLP